MEVAHSSALDRRNMHKHVGCAIGRLNKAKAFLRIEKLDSTLSHNLASFENANRRLCCTTSRSLASEFNIVLGSALAGKSRTGKTSNSPYIS